MTTIRSSDTVDLLLPLDGPPDALVEVHGRLVAQLAPGLAVVRLLVARFVLLELEVLDEAIVVPEVLQDPVRQRADIVVLVAGDVVDLARLEAVRDVGEGPDAVVVLGARPGG